MFYREKASGFPVTLVCRVMGVSRSAFYKALRRAEETSSECASIPDDEQRLVDRIKGLTKLFPEYGYRRIWALLRFGDTPIVINRKRVQRLMQIHGLQVKVRRHRAIRRSHLGRVEVNDSDLLWGVDMTKIWCGQDGWGSLFAFVDHCDRECVGFRFSLDARAERAREALDEAVTHRFGSPNAVPHDLQVRADNGSQFGANVFLKEIDRLGMTLTYTPYRSPQGNAIVERFFRSLKEECVWHHRFESFEHAEQVISEWIKFYNEERMHSRLGYRSPRQFREIRILRKNVA